MPAFSKQQAAARDAFHQAYGQAMMSWAALEDMIFYWFMTATNMEQSQARAVFYSARSFMGRRDMLAAALPHGPFDEATLDFLKACLRKASQFSSFRNAVAHGAVGLRDEDSNPTYILADPRILDPVPDEAAISVGELGTAAENFECLRTYLIHLHPDFRAPGTCPRHYLELVRSMPNDARFAESGS